MNSMIKKIGISGVMFALGLFGTANPSALGQAADPPAAEVDNLKINGVVDGEKAGFVITGDFKPGKPEEEKEKLIFSVRTENTIAHRRGQTEQNLSGTVKILQGEATELRFAVNGKGTLVSAKSEQAIEWGLRNDKRGQRYFVLWFDPEKPAKGEVKFTAHFRNTHAQAKAELGAISLLPQGEAVLSAGLITVTTSAGYDLVITKANGVTRVTQELGQALPKPPQSYSFQFNDAKPEVAFTATESDPDANRIFFSGFDLRGRLTDGVAAFTLKGSVEVRHPKGGKLPVVFGGAALASIPAASDYKVGFSGETYTLEFTKGGTYPVDLEFHARIAEKDGWSNIDFGIVPAALRPVKLSGWPSAISFDAQSASKPAIKGGVYDLFLTPRDRLSIRWKETKPVVIPKLFYSAEAAVHIAVGAGLARQINHFDYRVMQGRMSTLELDLIGDGEVVNVNGRNILNWSVKKQEAGLRLVVKLNSQQTSNYNLVVHTQTPLGAFPVRFQPMRLVPVNPVRYGGHLRLVNKGAVQLEPVSVDGLSQLSANRFPAASSIAALPNDPKLKPLVYRYSGGDYELEVLADNILPELTLSQTVVYQLGFNEITLDAEVELDIRDAPLREFTVRIPDGYTVAQLTAAALADYFLGPAENGQRPLRLVFSQPLEGRHLIQLRLEQNRAVEGDTWVIPRLDYERVKSVRGSVGVSASPGLRLVPAAMKDVNELAVVFFPKKIPGLQAAYRIKEPGWEATLGVERMELALQVDALHLYSIGQGIVYGSSVLNYLVGGKPVSELKVLVPADYANVELVGRDVRNWKLDEAADNSVTKSYTVYFQSTVFGDYTLLATFERQFNPEGETLAFNGVRPVDVQSEAGYAILIGKERFEQSQPGVEGELIALEPSEIPEEYRLLFDAPILAAYQYPRGGFTLNKRLKPLSRQGSLEQVGDRAAFETRVSNDGQAVTTATYFLKNRGHDHFEVALEKEVELWEAKVGGRRVIPITQGETILVPLPKGQNPNDPIEVLLKFAPRASGEDAVRVALPKVGLPLLLAEWNVMAPDPEYRLEHVAGNVTPDGNRPDFSGFARLAQGGLRLSFLIAGLAAFAGGLLVRWATRTGGHRWDWRNTLGQLLGWPLVLGALVILGGEAAYAAGQSLHVEPGLVFTSSVLKADEALSITVRTLEADAALYSVAIFLPAVAGLGIWVYRFQSEDDVVRRCGLLVGWLFIAWTALLVPNGVHCFAGLAILFVMVHVAWPSVAAQINLPPKPPKPPAPPKPTEGAAPAAAATAAILIGLFLGSGTALGQAAKPDGGRLLSVVQGGQAANSRVTLNGTLKWEAKTGSRIQFLSAPAVLKRIDLKGGKLKLAQFTAGKATSQQLIANEAGVYNVGFEYETRMTHVNGEWGFNVPTQPAMVNRMSLEMRGRELEVTSPDAVSLKHTFATGSINKVELVLPPKPGARVNWKPKARDESIEKPVFYAEFQQLFIPTAGIVAGVHDLKVRLAQGQLGEMTIAVPDGITVTDVTSKLVASWRFDPEVGTLQMQFSAPQKESFDLRVRSQQSAGAFPYEKTLGLLGVNGAAGELGLAGLATSSEVQLDNASVDGLAPINLEDFPAGMAQSVQGEFAGLTVRRAYRYSGRAAGLTLNASAVQPDIRVTTNQRLSLGEDRSVLLVNLAARITRAGVFKLSFALPMGLEIESITGNALSHWTDIRDGDDTIVTLHLKGKTEGNAQFQINLAGAGLEKTESWQVPRVAIREATKENGQLFIIPEQGIRVYMKDREGVSQLDPKQAGIRDRGVLAFRLLQGDWTLSFDVERVDPWIQAVFLQDASIRQGTVKYRGVLEYQIENTSVKTLRVALPDAAQGTGFSGDQVTDFVKGDAAEDGRAVWDVKLDRRMIGKYQLTVSYQVPLAEDATGQPVEVRSLQAVDVNLQRGFVSVRTEGRILLTPGPAPDGLYSVEWSQVPRSLKGALNLGETQLVYRSVKPATLSVTAENQGIAAVVDAQVTGGEFRTELSGSGNAVTQVILKLRQGDERELRVTLPKGSEFWSAFIDDKGVLPWEDSGRVVIPLEKNPGDDSESSVEFYYQSPVGEGEDKTLAGPVIDLPMEKLKWTVHAPAGLEIEVNEDDSTVTYHEAEAAPSEGGKVGYRGSKQVPQSASEKVYLDNEQQIQKRQTQKAEALLLFGNRKIAEGDQREARRALESAYKLSQNDAAFNEDARVQLQNLKTQQAMMGINMRRNNFLMNSGVASQQAEQQQAAIPLQQGKGVKYTQAQVKQVMDLNTIEDNTAFRRLAERIVRQQEAIEAETGAIQATLPGVGQVLNFSQSVQGKDSPVLQIVLTAKAGSAGFPTEKLGLLLALFIALGLIRLAAPKPE
ncbi:MAG: hypothetical protein H8E20_12930 [Verrucomicrobia bacterium]|nr:hypothetical protein [Verrucomicrobiota bacterium]